MNSRERVLKAFRRMDGYPDRVPIQFDLCRQLLEHFGEKLGIPVHYTHNLYEDVTYRISGNEIRVALGSDVIVTGASNPVGYTIEMQEDGTWFNEYQMRMMQGPVYVEVVGQPLAHVQTAADVAGYCFPDPNAPGRYTDVERLVKSYKDDYVVIGDMEVTIFALARHLVGMEKLLVDMAARAEYLDALFTACTDFQIEIGKNLVQRGVDAFWVGDDFGGQNGLLISPRMFRRFLKPHYARLVTELKAVNPHVIPILHSDGAVSKLLQDIREIGFEIFNPVQPGVPGHGPQDLKDGFGDDFIFWGAIDQQYLLPRGTDEELDADIQEKIRILGKDRGYMIAPAHIIQADVSPERVQKFIELCRKHGRYE